MDFQKLLRKVAEILEQLRIPYAVTGGYAVSVWGKPRSTLDVDVIIELFEPQIEKLTSALRRISKMSYVDEHMVRWAFERKGEFNFIHIESGIKVDFWISKGDEFSRGELRRRISKVIAGQRVCFVSPEDLILNKLRWHKESGSELQLRDVEVVMKFQKKLDKKHLIKWAKVHSTLEKLETIWEKVKQR